MEKASSICHKERLSRAVAGISGYWIISPTMEWKITEIEGNKQKR
jgi:hypothetical protein